MIINIHQIVKLDAAKPFIMPHISLIMSESFFASPSISSKPFFALLGVGVNPVADSAFRVVIIILFKPNKCQHSQVGPVTPVLRNQCLLRVNELLHMVLDEPYSLLNSTPMHAVSILVGDTISHSFTHASCIHANPKCTCPAPASHFSRLSSSSAKYLQLMSQSHSYMSELEALRGQDLGYYAMLPMQAATSHSSSD